MIDVEHVTMRFRMANDKVMSLKEYVVAILRKKLIYEELTVLDDVSFTVNKGEVMGIVGKNGAGKSTLLKIIAGVLKPTAGKVNTYGNIVPMLELGSGFDQELSGRENVYLNGAILGYSKEFLDSKYDEILDFSELKDFIEMPIRNYSSGMLMRLAFSIATVVRPEILIVDEILAVGDAGFQNKSKDRMLELMSGGTTVLFVSHSIAQIEQMCERVVWLEDHKIKMVDTAAVVCEAYREYWNQH
ncbi:MAG: ABC transporter ATP-binding protein [Lachnospiraceae bacterium]|nr:ABC transporter ATP-binding protein [Lachnospiraceae bacterium]